MLNRQIYIAVTILLLLVCQRNALALPVSIDFQPSTQAVIEGNLLTVGIFLNNDTGHLVRGVDLSINFDPSILGYVGYTVGPTISGMPIYLDNTTINVDSGNFRFSEIDLSGLNPYLISLQFLAHNTGVTSLTFLNTETGAYDIYGVNILASLGEVNVEVTSPVPEPSSFILLGVSLVGICIWRRIKKSYC